MNDDDPIDDDDVPDEGDDISDQDEISEEDEIAGEDDFEEELQIAKCSFCGRTAFEVERLIRQGEARICNICIKEFHARLNPKPTNGGA